MSGECALCLLQNWPGVCREGLSESIDSTKEILQNDRYGKNFLPWLHTRLGYDPVVILSLPALPNRPTKHRNNLSRAASAKRQSQVFEHKGRVRFNTPTFCKDVTA